MNVRFGFVKYAKDEEDPRDWEDVEEKLSSSMGMHPSKFLGESKK